MGYVEVELSVSRHVYGLVHTEMISSTVRLRSPCAAVALRAILVPVNTTGLPKNRHNAEGMVDSTFSSLS